MSELITPPLPTGPLPSASLATALRRHRTDSDASSFPGTVTSALGPWRERIDRHRRRLVATRVALAGLRDRSAADRALTEVGPIGAAAHWLR